MRHGKSGKTLGMESAHRLAVLRNMSVSLISHGRIQTTLTRAKVLRSFIEPLVTLGKKGDLSARRLALRKLPNKDAIKNLFSDIASGYQSRQGGYTRIIKTGKRKGDNADMAIIEFVKENAKSN